MSILELIVLSAAASAGIGYFANRFFRLFRTWFVFIEDWYGTDEKPGIVERLNDGQEHFNKIHSHLKYLELENEQLKQKFENYKINIK